MGNPLVSESTHRGSNLFKHHLWDFKYTVSDKPSIPHKQLDNTTSAYEVPPGLGLEDICLTPGCVNAGKHLGMC